eukprot:CAMPEP_0172631670 /NCGR_PEP_ID=MMETSP1068-20121228/180560_1 /TAXON_ID=35684 /ORGANISM="Pseudopedinella elastica, Strain CCMP716" /LENGTH=276 /DNA_ID=CAMNT_0013442877 /DNA_START=133 /DNA_END=963 /DNA_ORIENTATION=-
MCGRDVSGGDSVRRGSGVSKGHQLSVGVASLDATPRYMRVPLVPARIRALYGPVLARRLNFVLILRDPEQRAWSWFRFFALNAVQGKPWARDQLEKEFWVHFNDATFQKWVTAETNKFLSCQKNGIRDEDMWPACDSETGMFAGFYTAQLRYWLRYFEPDQFLIIPMDCYTKNGPALSLELLGKMTGLKVGKSLADIDRRLKPENNKRLKQITGGKNLSIAAAANRHSELGIPSGAARLLKSFFQHEGAQFQDLIREHPKLRVVDCGLPQFFRPIL